MSELVLSVVVIGRDEGARLERCLKSIRGMKSPGGDFEIIYVDSASKDGSRELAATYGAQVLSLETARPTAAKARNLGWRAAKAATILFLDGDTILDPDFASSSIGEFADSRLAIVWGHRREIAPENSIYNRVLDFDWVYPPGYTEFCGGDALMRRRVLEEVGGFDGRFIAGEEPEMCNRIRQRGYLILHVDRPMTGHDLAMMRWGQYWKRAVRAGYAYAQVAHRYWNSEHPLWKRDVISNVIRAGFLLALPLAALVTSLWLASPIPVLAAALIFILLVVRSAFRAGWKTKDPSTRVLYAAHSHFQQIPIFFGQLEYLWDRIRRQSRGLIEYKEPSQ
ncbi:MAG: glycosyltransferase [Acidobacteriota bacterium]|nr:MAG: glycosyltransferase [Acidobacteriota bacterium]